ncbi:MAG: hypothetical protein U0270_31505 [Labilithrix sp.]
MKTSFLPLLLLAISVTACSAPPTDPAVAGSEAMTSQESEESAESAESAEDAVQAALRARLPGVTELTKKANGFGGISYGFTVNGVGYMSWQRRSGAAYEWAIFETYGTGDGNDRASVHLASLDAAPATVPALVDALEARLGAMLGTPALAVALARSMPGLTYVRKEARPVQHLTVAGGQTGQPGPFRDTTVMVFAWQNVEYVYFTRDAGTAGPHRLMILAAASDWDGVSVTPMTRCAGTVGLAGVDTPGANVRRLFESYEACR